MLRRVLAVVAALIWVAMVFVLTFWVTFPSETFANRIRHEVPRLLGEDWSAEVGGVRPWWLGLSVQDVKLYREGSLEDGTQAPILTALMQDARARVSLFSLLRRAPYVSGSIAFADGELDWAVGTALDPKDGLGMTEVRVDGDKVPVADLASLLGDAVPIELIGDVAVHVELVGGEQGMRDATGRIAITGGQGLAVAGLPLPGAPSEVAVSALAVEFDVKDGKGTVQQGQIVTDLVRADVKGDVTFRDPIDRSSIDLELVIGDLSSDLAMFESFLGEKGTDGSWHWYCRGVVQRLSMSSCSQRERRTSSRVSERTAGGSSLRSTPIPAPDNESEEDRERRRQEAREKLAKRRAEREARQSGTTTPPEAVPVDEEEEVEEEEIDEPLEDEEEPVEEIPLDEEEPLE